MANTQQSPIVENDNLIGLVQQQNGFLSFIESIGVGIASVISAIAQPFIDLFGSSF